MRVGPYEYLERDLVRSGKNELKIDDEHDSEGNSGSNDPSYDSGCRLCHVRFRRDRFLQARDIGLGRGRFLQVHDIRFEGFKFAFDRHCMVFNFGLSRCFQWLNIGLHLRNSAPSRVSHSVIRYISHIYRDIMRCASRLFSGNTLRRDVDQGSEDAGTNSKQGNHDSNQAYFTFCRFYIALRHVSTKAFKGGIHSLKCCFGLCMFGIHPLLQYGNSFLKLAGIRRIVYTFLEGDLVRSGENKLKIDDQHAGDGNGGSNDPSRGSGFRLCQFCFKFAEFRFRRGRFLQVRDIRFEGFKFAFGRHFKVFNFGRGRRFKALNFGRSHCLQLLDIGFGRRFKALNFGRGRHFQTFNFGRGHCLQLLNIGFRRHAPNQYSIHGMNNGFGFFVFKAGISESLKLPVGIKRGFGHNVIQILRYFYLIYRNITSVTSLWLSRSLKTDMFFARHCFAGHSRFTFLLHSTFLAIPVAVSLGFFSPALTQQPIGATFQARDDRATLGDCPAQLLRQAWAEMLPLETAAVEREVLALCTERAETIAQFLRAQEKLNTTLALAVSPDVSTSGSASDQTVTRLREDVTHLQTRITRLEEGPAQPETDATLSRLRNELREVEADLRSAEFAQQSAAAPPVTKPDRESDSSLSTDDDNAAITPRRTVDQPSPPGLETPDETDVRVSEPASLPHNTLPIDPDCAPPTLSVNYAVRGDRDWTIVLQESREVLIRIPRSPEGGSDDPISETEATFDAVCQPEVDPPLHVTLNDVLPSGLIVQSVTSAGVEIRDPDNDAVEIYPFATDSSPGDLRWDVYNVPTVWEGGE